MGQNYHLWLQWSLWKSFVFSPPKWKAPREQKVGDGYWAAWAPPTWLHGGEPLATHRLCAPSWNQRELSPQRHQEISSSSRQENCLQTSGESHKTTPCLSQCGASRWRIMPLDSPSALVSGVSGPLTVPLPWSLGYQAPRQSICLGL